MRILNTAVFALLLCMVYTVSAQQVELSGFYGYQLNGNLNTYYGKFDVQDSPNYGGSLGVEIRGNTFLEFSYDRNDSEFNYSRNGISVSEPAKIATEYYMLGTSQQFGIDDKIKPYAGANLGVVRFHAKEPIDLDGDGSYVNANDEYSFGVALQAGLKYFFNDKVGLRLQARLLLPMYMNGIFISGGTGGAGGGASFNVPMVSGNFTAGLVFRLKN